MSNRPPRVHPRAEHRQHAPVDVLLRSPRRRRPVGQGLECAGADGATTDPFAPAIIGETGHAPTPSNRFRFAVFGDTRPAVINGKYPTTVVTAIFRQIESANVQFVVFNGDSEFISPGDTTSAAAQLTTSLTCRSALAAATPVHYVLGNHEKTVISTW